MNNNSTMQLDLFDKSNGSLEHIKDMDDIDLFSLKNNFRIVRLDENDAKYLTDNISTFKNLLNENEDMYPGIKNWVDSKVIPGLQTQERTAFIGYLNEKPIVTAVVKKGKQSKFCHLKIYDDFQNVHLGELFLSLMALEARNSAEEIHFTLPESLWTTKSYFFKSFGFRETDKSGTQYRTFDNELKCSAPFSAVWNAFIEKLPKLIHAFSVSGYSMNNKLLMSFHPKYVNRILEGKKRIEIRKKFSTKWVNHRVNLYSSSPECAIVGEALIKNICVGSPEQIWKDYSLLIGCTKMEFDTYVGQSNEIYALILDEIKPYGIKIPSSQLSYLLNTDLIPPQSYSILKENTMWSTAVSIATLLHKNYKVPEYSNI